MCRIPTERVLRKDQPSIRSEFFEGRVVKLSVEKIRKKLRSFAGASLWVAQTRLGVIYMPGTLGSKVIRSRQDVATSKGFIALAKKTLFRIVSPHIPFRFVSLFLGRYHHRYNQMFSFCDASMASS